MSNTIYSTMGSPNPVESFHCKGDPGLTKRVPPPFLDTIRLDQRDFAQTRLGAGKRDSDCSDFSSTRRVQVIGAGSTRYSR